MKHLTKIFIMTLLASFISISFAQEKSDKEETKEHKMEMKGDNHDHMDMKDHKNMKMDETRSTDDSIVREGEIDLNAIDENGDGMVYQDMMDWNVISDEPGECPLCGMKLKEVSLDQAKDNLLKHNFKVKK